jgi:hypothetical protein
MDTLNCPNGGLLPLYVVQQRLRETGDGGGRKRRQPNRADQEPVPFSLLLSLDCTCPGFFT